MVQKQKAAGRDIKSKTVRTYPTANPLQRAFFYLETAVDPQESAELIAAGGYWYRHSQSHRQQLPVGQTIAALVFDLWRGFHPDSFAALCGCVQGGGFVVLLGPPLAKLHLFQDPGFDLISGWPKICPLDTSYLQRLQTSLHGLRDQHYLIQINALTPTSYGAQLQMFTQRLQNIDRHKPAFQLTVEQSDFIEQITAQIFAQSSPDWFGLIANRGFGKTTALRFLCAKLLSNLQTSQSLTINFVTQQSAHRNEMLQWLQQQKIPTDSFYTASLQTLLKQSQRSQQSPTRRLIIIDEVAAFNRQELISALTQLDQPHHLLIFAGSVDGYEGSGKAMLHLPCPRPITYCHLTKALRWTADDPLARWLQHFFYIHTPDLKALSQTTLASSSSASFPLTPVDTASEDQISQWMALMSLAHYRTRPGDLRVMLDAPNQTLYGYFEQGQLIAGVWLSLEGPMPRHLHHDILAGKRRLKGHLAPQYLARHLDAKALDQQWLRIVRIAVRPDQQGQGIGSQLINACLKQYQTLPLAVSFKPTPALQVFWEKVGFTRVTPSFYRYLEK